MPQPARMQRLTAALRATASQTATATGGCALLFAAIPGDESSEATTRLRAAAGFASPDLARQASQAVLSATQEAVSTGQPQSVREVEALGSQGGGAVRILPLVFEDRIHGKSKISRSEIRKALATVGRLAIRRCLGRSRSRTAVPSD